MPKKTPAPPQEGTTDGSMQTSREHSSDIHSGERIVTKPEVSDNKEYVGERPNHSSDSQDSESEQMQTQDSGTQHGQTARTEKDKKYVFPKLPQQPLGVETIETLPVESIMSENVGEDHTTTKQRRTLVAVTKSTSETREIGGYSTLETEGQHFSETRRNVHIEDTSSKLSMHIEEDIESVHQEGYSQVTSHQLEINTKYCPKSKVKSPPVTIIFFYVEEG